MEFKEIVMKRYATKKFDGKMIPQAKVEELLEIIRFAPTSYNIQPWKIKVVTNQKVKEQLAPVAWNQAQITSCSHLLVFCANTNIMGNIDLLEKAMPNAKEYIGMMRGFASGMNVEQSKAWAQRQTYLALGNAVNGAKALGFDSCPMEGFNALEFQKILDLPVDIVPTVLCPIGYAADTQPAKFRFAKEEMIVL